MPLLEIDIEARYAKFQDALSSIQRDTKKAADSMSRDFSGVKSVIGGLAGAVSVGSIALLVKSAIDAADNLEDMSQKTGIAVDVLNGLGFAAGQAGGSLESIVDAAGKLNKSIASAASGTKESLNAFKALGVGVLDAAGNLKTADVVMAEIADRFATFRDGPEKAAIAVALFGKAGADMIPFLNAGGESLRANVEYAKQYSGVTSDLTKLSGEFNDTLAKLTIQQGNFGNVLAADVLPILNLVSERMLGAAENTDVFSLASTGIRTALEAFVVIGSEVAHTFKMVGDEIGGTLAQLAALATLDFKGFSAIGDAMAEDQANALKKQEEFIAKVLDRSKAISNSTGAPTPGEKPPAPKLAGSQPAGPSPRDVAREAQLRDLERSTDAELRLLDVRSEFLQTYYQNDLIAAKEYFAELRAAQAESIRIQESAIDREITLRQGSKPKDARAAANNDSAIKELQDRKVQLQAAAELTSVRTFVEENKAAQAFAATLKGINAELLEQQGFSPEAAGIRFDLQNDQTFRRLDVARNAADASGDEEGRASLDLSIEKLKTMRELVVAQARINAMEEIGAGVQFSLIEATERAQIAAQQGSITELESLRQVSDARLQAVADLQQVADQMTKAADATGSARAIENARAFQLEIDKLAASADKVRERFQDAFAGPLESSIEKLIDGTATLKDAFKGLLADVGAELTRMFARDFTKQLLSKDGALGGVVDFTSGIFGGKSTTATPSADIAGSLAKATGAGADTAAATAAAAALATLSATIPLADAGLIAMSASTVAADASILAMSAAAGVAASALASVAGSSAASGAGSFLGGLVAAENGHIFNTGNVVPFAKGGMPGIVNAPTFFPMKDGRTGLMGEAGPEAIMPLKSDGSGRLSVTMIDERGKASLLPVTRDQAGRMAVQGSVKAFASGGVISGGDIRRTAQTAVGMQAGVTQAASPTGGEASRMVVENHFTITGAVNASSQAQIAAAAAKGVERARRRNT